MQRVFASSTSVSIEDNKFNSDWSKCRVMLPKSSDYSAYYITLPKSLCVDFHGYYAIYLYDSNTYELIRTEREQGKRYARPKINGSEIINIFQQDEANVMNSANLWLAEITHYENQGLLRSRELVVGSLDRNSFYVNGNRHNVNSFGLTLLRPLNYEDKQSYDICKSEVKALSEQKNVMKSKIEYLNKAIEIQPQTHSSDIEAQLLKLYSDSISSIDAAIVQTQTKFKVPSSDEIAAARKKHIQELAETKTAHESTKSSKTNNNKVYDKGK